jgi:hypothetical protein
MRCGIAAERCAATFRHIAALLTLYLVSLGVGAAVVYRASRLVGAIILAGFAAAVAAFACCIFPLVFPALSNTSTEAVAFLFTLRCLAIAALGFSFSLIYASRMEPPEWARVLLWFGIFFVAVEITVSWSYPSVAPRM